MVKISDIVKLVLLIQIFEFCATHPMGEDVYEVSVQKSNKK